MASLIFGVVSLDFAILAGFTALLLLVASAQATFPHVAPSAWTR